MSSKVQVEQGWLEGEILETVTKDGEYHSFKGIPYAEPPVGKLRFKAPQPPVKWEGVRKATEHGPTSIQFDIFLDTFVPGEEDCLYLNVYSPNLNPKTPYPVMVFIHGGGFKCGSGNTNFYGPDFLVSHGVISVTINYRLEALGFLCLDTEDVPGNAGLKDQVAALRWVQRNIAQFGGDPNNVTVFGESAGGASTCFHVLSPMSKGLFHKGIAMSGVPLCDWALPYEPRRRAFVLGKQLGIITEDPNELLEYLQSVPVEKLVNTAPYVLASEPLLQNNLKMYHFTPVVEKDFGQEAFINKPVEDILRSGNINDVDLMMGYTSSETLVGLVKLQELNERFEQYPEMFLPRELMLKFKPDQALEIGERIRKYYLGDRSITPDTIGEFVQYCNDSCFLYNIYRFLRLLPDNMKRYLYRFSCVSERNIFSAKGREIGLSGAAHLDDLMYIFDAKLFNIPINKSEKSYKMINQTCALFTNFAKFGNPTPDDSLTNWPEYDNESGLFLDIDEKLVVGAKDKEETWKFWQSVYDSVNK